MLALRTLLSASAISFLAVSFLLRGSFVDMARTLAKRRWRRQCREVGAQDGHAVAGHGTGRDDDGMRSEEHTSELQSLMRTSYAVFCLNKHNTVVHIRAQLHK